MRFISFGSGSSGNCYYLEEEGFGIFLDLGIGPRLLKRYMQEYGVLHTAPRAAFLTHDHTDHVKASGVVAAEYGIPVYAAAAVHRGILANPFLRKKIPTAQQRELNAGEAVQCGPFTLLPFCVPHDASANFGFFIEAGGVNFCLMTDAGEVTDEMIGYMRRAQNLVIECNYDEAKLSAGRYPPKLQARIKSPTGHLDNQATAAALREHLTDVTRHVWLCHLSEENNHPDIVRFLIEDAVSSQPTPPAVTVLKRRTPMGFYELS